MISIGLTGNIGSGKTIISKIFESFGVPVYCSDTEAKKLYDSKEVSSRVLTEFGYSILSDSNEIDKNKLATMVFSNPELLKQLNGIIHPLVKNHYENWKKQHTQSPYHIHESAVLFESSFSKIFDKIIVVSAPKELRFKRILKRSDISISQIETRENAQWKEIDKIKQSDYCIVNDDKQTILPQALRIHNSLLENTY